MSVTNFEILWLDGNCPVQAEGVLDGHIFYFRARGDSWALHVAPTEEDIFDGETEWVYEEDYGDGPYDAGWMTPDEARAFIDKAVAIYRVRYARDLAIYYHHLEAVRKALEQTVWPLTED